MQGINEIRRANYGRTTDKDASYTALRHGGVIVRLRDKTRTIDGPVATELLTKLRDASPARRRELIAKALVA